jgi:hypothetical protein
VEDFRIGDGDEIESCAASVPSRCLLAEVHERKNRVLGQEGMPERIHVCFKWRYVGLRGSGQRLLGDEDVCDRDNLLG